MNRTRIHRPLFAALTGLVAMSILSACSSAAPPAAEPDPTTSGDAGTVETLNVLVVPAIDSTIVYVAQEQGLFEKHGLEVNVTTGQGGAAIAAALQSGGADIGIVNYVSLLSGVANGLPLSIIAAGALGGEVDPGLYVMEDGAISDAADLKGKNIGVVSTGSISDFTTNVALADAGLKPEDVTYVSVPVPNLVAALTGGQVDAVYLDQPSSFQAESEGATRLFSGFSGEAADLPIAGFVASNAWAGEHASAIEKFRAAIAEAVAAYDSDPELGRSLVPTFTAITADQLGDMVMPRFEAELNLQELQRVPDLMLEYGLLTEPLDASDAVID